jgi:hypothetical protein
MTLSEVKFGSILFTNLSPKNDVISSTNNYTRFELSYFSRLIKVRQFVKLMTPKYRN